MKEFIGMVGDMIPFRTVYEQKKKADLRANGYERGAWWTHKVGKFTDKTKIKKVCPCCNAPYTITKNKNLVTNEIEVYGGSIKRNKKSPYYIEYSMYDKALQFMGHCPNCQHEEELFCEDLNIPMIGDINERSYRVE